MIFLNFNNFYVYLIFIFFLLIFFSEMEIRNVSLKFRIGWNISVWSLIETGLTTMALPQMYNGYSHVFI